MRTLIITALTVLGLDQAVKFLIKSTMKLYQSIPVIKGFLNITYIENSGVSYGMLGNVDHPAKRWVLLGIVALAMAAILTYWYKYRSPKFLYNFSCGLIIGGALGNFTDRLLVGRITDFIEVYHKSWHFPVFNVADSAISVGVFFFILFMLIYGEEKNAPHNS